MKSHGGKKPVRVHLLNGESVLLVFDPKAHVKDVFDQICAMHYIEETQLFGLAFVTEQEYQFMDLKQKLSKYAPKEWNRFRKKENQSSAVHAFEMQFRVQFFVAHPKLISDSQSRHHYYLQLKRNVLHSKIVAQDEMILGLAATALHLDLGIYDKCLHTDSYFRPKDYVPKWFIEKWGEAYLKSHLPTMHADLATTPTYQAQSNYIQQASSIDDVAVHFYKLFKTKTEKEPSVVLAITHLGIRIHHVTIQRSVESYVLNFEFPWNKVGRLFFATKRFEIYPEDQPASRKLTYYTGSHSRSKYLLWLLKNTHSLYLSLSPLAHHLRKTSGSNSKTSYRESYISGMDLEIKTDEIKQKDWTLNHNNPKYTQVQDQPKKLKGLKNDPSPNKIRSPDSKIDINPTNTDCVFDDPFSDDCECSDSPSGEVICVTQEHLEAPPIKNLSVTNLMDAILGEVDIFRHANNVWPTDAHSLKKEQDASSPVRSKKDCISTDVSHQKTDGLKHRTASKTSESSENSAMLKMKTHNSTQHATVIRKSSNISEILDLFPDVSALQAVTDEKSNRCLFKSASEDQLNDASLCTTAITASKRDILHRQPPSYETATRMSRQRRTQSMDIELMFDFDTCLSTISPNESKLYSQNVEKDIIIHTHSTSMPLKYDSNYCKSSEKNGRNNEATDRNLESHSTKFLRSSKLKVKEDSQRPKKYNLVKTTSLCRSQRQNDIPFTFGTNKKCFNVNQNNVVDDPLVVGRETRDNDHIDKLEIPRMSEIFDQRFPVQHHHSRMADGKSSSFYLQPLEHHKQNGRTKIRPASAGTKPQVALRHKNEHHRNRSRPRSLDFTSFWNSNEKSSSPLKTSRSTSAKRQTMFMLENFTEVIV